MAWHQEISILQIGINLVLSPTQSAFEGRPKHQPFYADRSRQRDLSRHSHLICSWLAPVYVVVLLPNSHEQSITHISQARHDHAPLVQLAVHTR